MSSTTTVCIPWRPTPNRIAAHDRCVKFWTDNGFPVIEADSDPDQPFLCNQARNNAVRQAASDVVVVADADMLPATVEQMGVAIDYAANTGQLVWPHDAYFHIPADRVESALPPATRLLGTADNRGCGLIVISRAAYWEIGGFDEGFVHGVGGLDDLAFTCAAETLLGIARAEGVVYLFDQADEVFHRNRDGVESSDSHPNSGRFQFYEAAWSDPAQMRALIENRPAPGVVWEGEMPQREVLAKITLLKWAGNPT